MTTPVRWGFALEYVTDVQQAKRFFTDVLGLQVDRDHPTFVQFKDQNGAAYAIASDEPMAPPIGPELWWVVDNAEQAYHEMSKGTEVTAPLQQKPFGTCFGLKAPSGQVHYVLQFPEQRPSQQV
jgi:catechol 2,3-dioxygenase-like lactoylglutathione lyase family enzyme